MRRLNVVVVAWLAAFLVSCSTVNDPVDPRQLQGLVGHWRQADGAATLVVYRDEQVKLTMPDEKPPLRLLSTLETNKKHGLVFSIGDRWAGPVYVVREGRDALKLTFPPEDPREQASRTLRFVRGD